MKKLMLRELKGKDYTLALTRESIKWLEAVGFSLEDFARKPISCYDMIWQSLFIANHKDLLPKDTLELMDEYEKQGNNPTEVVKFAIEEYKSFMNALADTNSKKTLEIIEG